MDPILDFSPLEPDSVSQKLGNLFSHPASKAFHRDIKSANILLLAVEFGSEYTPNRSLDLMQILHQNGCRILRVGFRLGLKRFKAVFSLCWI